MALRLVIAEKPSVAQTIAAALGVKEKKVRFYRIQRGYSQQQLADKLETLAVYICRGSISRIEDYSRTVTDLELVALAEVLQVSVLDLLPESLFA